MPYFIWDESPTCSGWAVVKEDGSEVSCHKDKLTAIEAMDGLSAIEGLEPGGTYTEQEPDTDTEQAELRVEACEDCDGNCEVCKAEVRKIPLALKRARIRRATNAEGNKLSDMETRVFTNEFEVREEAEGMRLTGYAARFNEPSEPLPFIERIAPGAFKRSLKSRNDIKLLWNHDSSMVLGSTRAGTLKLNEDERGLFVDAILPDTSYGRDARVSIQRGDVTGFSFGFTVPAGGDSWNNEGTERTLKSVRLLEVSTGVAFPAYPSTNGTAQVRGLDKIAERTGIDADALADALLKIEDGQEITGEEKDMLSRVISDLAPQEVVEEKPDLSILTLKKKKLDLLAKGIL